MKRRRENQIIKEDLVSTVSMETGITKDDVDCIITATVDLIRDRVTMGVEVKLNEFGIFKTRIRPPKIARNLKGKGNKRKNPEPIVLPATTVIHFKPSKKFFTGTPVCNQVPSNQLKLL